MESFSVLSARILTGCTNTLDRLQQLHIEVPSQLRNENIPRCSLHVKLESVLGTDLGSSNNTSSHQLAGPRRRQSHLACSVLLPVSIKKVGAVRIPNVQMRFQLEVG